MQEFRITAASGTETFREGNDYASGETRQHWTLSGLEKLINLGLWKREIDKRGNVKVKPPSVEMIMRFANARRVPSAEGG